MSIPHNFDFHHGLLDEKGVSQANELITRIQYYVEAHPESHFLVYRTRFLGHTFALRGMA